MLTWRLTAVVALLAATVGARGGLATAPFERPLASDKQAIHVLNRLAYGLNAADLERVRRLGIRKWIQLQLRPERIAESPVLEAKLALLETLRVPTWQLYEKYQTPQAGMMMSSDGPSLRQLLPKDQLATLTRGTIEERRALFERTPAGIRKQLLLAAPAKALEGLPDIQATAFNERAAEQRRLRPPLTDVLTEGQLMTLGRGSDAEKTALLSTLDLEKRRQVLRQVAPFVLPEQFRREAIFLGQPAQVPIVELVDARLYRAAYSTRQLQEVLVDFWMNHFNVFRDKGAVRMLLASYERDAIRPHVLGRFRDMLLATARHPAMLFYLDNWRSQAPRDDDPLTGLNENYGRELLELHTLGVDGGYTQTDVIEVARAFTGWTIHEPDIYGEFYFNPAMHDRDDKVVLGRTIPRGGGEDDGLRVIDIVARHPSTARFISRKLAQRFVADDPPRSLVDRMATAFTRTDGDLRAVMETLLLSPEFLSEDAWQAKVKSPLELVVSALRVLDADVTDTVPIAQRLADLGQRLYGKSEPTGYTNVSRTWVNSAGLIGRVNFATAITSGQLPGVRIRPRGTTASVQIASPDFQKR